MAISGQIVNVGDHIDVSYSGSIQQYEIPFNGLYQLEVWGGEGGYTYKNNKTVYGGKGGKSSGYKKLNKGQIIYIVVGGGGGNSWNDPNLTPIYGGYNGGGHGYSGYSFDGGGGGGATHIAPISGLLSNENVWESVYIVAGGGGGGAYQNELSPNGSAGGGLTTSTVYKLNRTDVYALGATQTSGYARGQGANHPGNGSGFGGGGGGYYGGNGNSNNTSGTGGSGYIGGVPEVTIKGVTYTPSTTNGGNSGNGKATITYVAKTFPTVYLGENQIDGGHLGGLDLETIYLGENELA